MFFGRQFFLEELNNFYRDDTMKLACIYGRRGIGKTALAREFSSDKTNFYFNAYATTGIREVELFARALGYKKKFADSQAPLAQLSAILEDLRDRAEMEEAPVVLIMDSYPFFARADAGFDKAFFDFMESAKNIKVIFLGDSYLAMAKLFKEKKSIWKDSLSLCFELPAMGFYESMEFLSEITDPVERAIIYGITGGIPIHLSKAIGDYKSTIKALFFADPDAGYTPERTIQTELRELSYYNHILTTLADGFNRVNQISKYVGKPKDVVVPYMNTLMDIGIVTKENPVTEKNNRKKTRYSIINSFDLFWYSFFAPYIDIYNEGDMDAFMEVSVNPGLKQFMDTVFISMCKEYLQRKGDKGELPLRVTEIGNWWQNDDEKQTTQGFDLVAVGEASSDEAMVFGCCYYNDEPVGIALLKELIDLTKQVKGKKNVFYLVFSKSGFHENTTTVAASIKNILLVSLEDIING